ncbi:hypothetical protein N5D03_07555 [Empedobacter sp. GD03861]|uniref:hypothetical protein n=1 Tax=Empedobacter sp. GD03861 TaxID=2975390 RepID=UPI0024479411|nr:hypothetical protein [Empedobacter sp. GD03861]MDH0674394.1 hypothetical protein [Empedobacter sp. GD03861]
MVEIEKVNHYTSIDSLEKILESKKILFKRFDLMDDQTENEGVPEIIKKNFFISCWSKESREMIPQWAMYAPKGIRIELPKKWFKKDNPVNNEGVQMPDIKEFLGENHPAANMFFPLPWNELINKDFMITPPFDSDSGFITEVSYCKDYKEKKEENWWYDDLDKTYHIKKLSLDCFVKYKDEYWDFQNEIRYYLHVINRPNSVLPEFILAPISSESLAQIKITLYPNCTKEDELKVIEICEKHLDIFNPEIQIRRSDLDGKYKSKN